MRRDHDDDELGVDRQHALQPVETLAAGRLAGAEIHVQQHGVEVVLGEQRRDAVGLAGGLDRGEVAPQQQPARRQDVLVVVDDQNVSGAGHGSSRLSGIVHPVSASVQFGALLQSGKPE